MCGSSWVVYPLDSYDLFSGIYLQFLCRGSRDVAHCTSFDRALGKAAQGHDFLMPVHQHISPRGEQLHILFCCPVDCLHGMFTPAAALIASMLEKQLSRMIEKIGGAAVG